ncbi:hypothetical protein PIB30_011177 [Stylosanthes scabra]|uniref:DUF4283 domain-containing protein n=1 Tax=Stylosanthes scabra TaxID=79078 RepID=A0ABU6R6Y6_9FABA|nr:hypothetical protein [Stylosanthes scabra]
MSITGLEHRVRSTNDKDANGSDQKGRWDERNTFSIFADNLPADVTLGWLWKVFSSIGEVVDLVESRYKRSVNDSAEKEQKGDRWNANNGGSVRNIEATKQGKSYKDAVLNGSNDGGAEKMKRSLVGETMCPFDFNTLKEVVLEECTNVQEGSMIGSMKMLLTKGETNRLRRCWVEVVGLPLHGWSVENMRKIGEVWGRVIEAFADVVIDEEIFRIFVKEVDICHICLKNKDVINNLVLEVLRDEDDQRENPPPTSVRRSGTMAVKGNREGVVEKIDPQLVPESPMMDGVGLLALAQDDGKIDTCVECPATWASPTQTRSIEDDRRTEDVIREKIKAFGLLEEDKSGKLDPEEEVDLVAQKQHGLDVGPVVDPS